MASKVFHSATHGRHWTPFGVAGYAVSDRISLDSVIIHREEETDKVCLFEDVIGGRRGAVGLLSNEELDVLETEEVLGGVGTSLAVFACPEEEEECDPGEIF